MKYKKKDLSEAKYMVDKEDVGEFNNDMKDKIEDTDVVQVIDVNEEEEVTEEEEVIEESTRAIITKKNLMRVIKENRNHE